MNGQLRAPNTLFDLENFGQKSWLNYKWSNKILVTAINFTGTEKSTDLAKYDNLIAPMRRTKRDSNSISSISFIFHISRKTT